AASVLMRCDSRAMFPAPAGGAPGAALHYNVAQTVANATFWRNGPLAARHPPPTTLRLSGFMPFRLYRLAAGVSQHLSDIYRPRFALEVPEWRVLVTVGEDRGCTAQYVAASTRMHKTRVSRALASLRRRGLIERAASAHDKRALQLR